LRRTYSGRTVEVGAQILQDLFADIDQLKRRP